MLIFLWQIDATADERQYRGFYVNAFSPGLKSPGEIDRLVADIVAARGNLIVAQVGRRGDAYYNNSYQPRTEDPSLRVGFDALQYLLDKAHAQSPRIEVHAWLSTCAAWSSRTGAPPRDPNHVFNQHGPLRSGQANWFTKRIDGTKVAGSDYYLDSGHPEAVDYIVRMYAHVVANYGVDGIHLDRVRLPEVAFRNPNIPEWGYNATAVARFNEAYQRTGTPAPADPLWVTYRREALRALVRKIYLVCTAIKPQIKISASTVAFGEGPRTDEEYRKTSTYRQVLQDPVGWLQEGIIDLNMPMNYDRGPDKRQNTWFENWVRYEKEHAGNRQVVPATALFLNSISSSVAQFRAVLSASLQGGNAAGVMGYSYHSRLSDGRTFYDVIRALTRPRGIDPQGALFPTPIETPDTPWKKNPTTGSLMGWISRRFGTLIDGAEIKLQGPEVRIAKSDGSGWFGVVDLPPGDYLVSASKFPAHGNLRISAGEMTTIELQEGQTTRGSVYSRTAALLRERKGIGSAITMTESDYAEKR